jgi:hypothetical protein
MWGTSYANPGFTYLLEKTYAKLWLKEGSDPPSSNSYVVNAKSAGEPVG